MAKLESKHLTGLRDYFSLSTQEAAVFAGVRASDIEDFESEAGALDEAAIDKLLTAIGADEIFARGDFQEPGAIRHLNRGGVAISSADEFEIGRFAAFMEHSTRRAEPPKTKSASLSFRDAILRGVAAAHRVKRRHAALSLTDDGAVDVFRLIIDSGYELLFRPLDTRLGLCIREPSPAILVTTRRPLSIQRYTAAHELGHLVMGHDFGGAWAKADTEDTVGEGAFIAGSANANIQEIEAEAFAAELLATRDVLAGIARRQHWSTSDLCEPAIIYQLSLRLSLSYKATVWALLRHRFIDDTVAAQLISVPPRKIKERLLGNWVPEDFRRDVWLLTTADCGGRVVAGTNDIFVFVLQEHGSAGYLWNRQALHDARLNLVLDEARVLGEQDSVGGAVEWRWICQAQGKVRSEVRLDEFRPWRRDDVLNKLHFSYDTWGNESGLPRCRRPDLLEEGN